MPTAASCAIVIFGASGDLARRKLIPAVYELAKENLLHDSSYVVGYSRSEMSDEQFRKTAREAVEKHARSGFDQQVWKKLEPRLFYIQADYGSTDDHARCGSMLNRLDQQFGAGGNRLNYIATPPEAFAPIITCLGERERAARKQNGQPKTWRRIIIEKPYGH